MTKAKAVVVDIATGEPVKPKKRKALSKKTRFEVFKRDSFTCQYCGGCAPSVVLVVDHIEPVSKGGDNALVNLVTSCDSCNAGKSNRRLADDSAVSKQHSQLKVLQEKREQLTMMVEWKRSLANLDDEAVTAVEELWYEWSEGSGFSEHGRKTIGKLVRKYQLSNVIDAMRAATDDYLARGADGLFTQESRNKSFNYIERIARFRSSTKDKPYMRDVLYVRAIVRNNFNYCNPWEARDLIERVHLAGYDFATIKDVACEHKSWSGWTAEMHQMLEVDLP